jgi:Flp pilus assembly protein TadD
MAVSKAHSKPASKPAVNMDGLVEQANTAAGRGDWQKTAEFLEQAERLEPGHAGILTGLGTSHLQLGLLDQAEAYFQKAVAAAPGSADAHNNLGVALAAAGKLEAAQQAYEQAVSLAPDHVQAWKNLAVAYLQMDQVVEGVQVLATLVKNDPHDPETLFLLAGCYEQGEQYESARTLYEEALKHDPAHACARQALDRLASRAAPAINPARIARPEHAQKLAALKGLVKNRPAEAPITTGAQDKWVDQAPASAAGRQTSQIANLAGAGPLARLAGFFRDHDTIFYGSMGMWGGQRMEILSGALNRQGLRAEYGSIFEPSDLDDHDFFLFSQPNLFPDLINGINACIQQGKPYAVDIDQDYFHLPQEHPAYGHFGPGNPRAMQALKIILAEAQWVSVPAAGLVDTYQPYSRRVEIIPPFWSRENRLWEKPSPRRRSLNVGWIGTAAERADLLTIQHDLVKFIQETPDAQLILAGDPGAYEAFDQLPEARRLFLPASSAEDIPYLLSQFDLLLIPLLDNPYNQSRSDQALMEAGVRRLPWIASPIPAYREWEAGGILIEQSDSWCSAFVRLAGSAQAREELGRAGRQKAEARQL